MSEQKVKYQAIKPVEVVAEKEIQETEEVKERLESVVTGEVKPIKKGLLERLVIGMLGPDGLPGIFSHVSQKIIRPQIENMVQDSLHQSINMMFGRNAEHRDTGGYYTPYGTGYHTQRTNYRGQYQPQNPEPATNSRRRVQLDYRIPTREEAIDVLEVLRGNCNTYGMVSVADYYDLINIDAVFTDNSYGWMRGDLDNVGIRVARGGGYVIELPPIKHLK